MRPLVVDMPGRPDRPLDRKLVITKRYMTAVLQVASIGDPLVTAANIIGEDTFEYIEVHENLEDGSAVLLIWDDLSGDDT